MESINPYEFAGGEGGQRSSIKSLVVNPASAPPPPQLSSSSNSKDKIQLQISFFSPVLTLQLEAGAARNKIAYSSQLESPPRKTVAFDY